LLAGPALRFEVLPDAERAVRVDAPGELDPELVLFPDFAGIRLTRVGDGTSQPLQRGAAHRLPEAEPLRVVRLVRVEVVALGPDAGRQDVVGECGRLAPRRRQRDVETDL